MFFFRHPKPVIDGRAVAVQISQKKITPDANFHVLLVRGDKPDQTDTTPTISAPSETGAIE